MDETSPSWDMHECRPGPRKCPRVGGRQNSLVPGFGSHLCHLVALSLWSSLGLVCSLVEKIEPSGLLDPFLLFFVADPHLVVGH